jgi:acyl-CoA oxidase
MITQQVAQYLIKKMTEAVNNPSAATNNPTEQMFQVYLANRSRYTPQNVISGTKVNDQAIVNAFQWRAADLSYRVYQARVVQKKPWTALMVQLHNLSRAYSEQILVTTFHKSFKATQSTLSGPTPEVLRTCFRLFALYTLDQAASSFTLTNAATPETTHIVGDVILDLMSELRPHAVKLVDAWAIPDWLMGSALGRSDGKVYEELYDMAHRRNPLNRVTFNPDWRSDEIVMGSGAGAKELLAKL